MIDKNLKYDSSYTSEPLFYKNHEKTIWQTYNETSDGSLRFHDDVDNYQVAYSIFYKIFYQHLKDFVKNKIIVDAGSGTGRNFPILSTFKPKKILSVEMYEDFIPEQKLFSTCVFPFLKNKKIATPIEFYNETMESFVDRKLNIDTIFFFESWHLMKFDYIFNSVNCDLVFCTHPLTHFNLNECLKKYSYKLEEPITINDKNNQKNYFFAVAKKT